ncbi:trypsin [Anoplophora glabripennis]|nr:trypsin [Anoplophora glabripennis]
MFALLLLSLLTISSVLGVPPLEGPYLPGGRIVGGEDADIADYPYQLCLIFEDFGPFCGAILIDEEWALTAAHCTLDAEANNLTVRAGSSLSTSGGQLVNVEKIYQHKGFNYDTAENDISLLKLASKVTVANSKVIALATSKPKANETATITGWGITDELDESMGPEVLQVVQVPVADQEDCKKAFIVEGVTDTMFCAGFFNVGGKDACTGDSGGPLVVEGVVAGITSWSKGCARPDRLGVYTNVASFLDWIEETKNSDQ